jgi:hypothetical protein
VERGAENGVSAPPTGIFAEWQEKAWSCCEIQASPAGSLAGLSPLLLGAWPESTPKPLARCFAVTTNCGRLHEKKRRGLSYVENIQKGAFLPHLLWVENFLEFRRLRQDSVTAEPRQVP